MHLTMRSQGGVHDHDSVSDPPAGDACILILGCMNADADACVRGRFRILVLEKVHKIGFRILEKVQKIGFFCLVLSHTCTLDAIVAAGVNVGKGGR
jgi:hypothetical protein